MASSNVMNSPADLHRSCTSETGSRIGHRAQHLPHALSAGLQRAVNADYFALASAWKFAEGARCFETWLVIAPLPSAEFAAEASAE